MELFGIQTYFYNLLDGHENNVYTTEFQRLMLEPMNKAYGYAQDNIKTFFLVIVNL